MGSGIHQQHNVAVEFFKNCLQVVRTLREHWILESKNDRGVIFEKTFVFGIQQLYVDALIKVCRLWETCPNLIYLF
jgi:stress-induced-phosphoprotein 1